MVGVVPTMPLNASIAGQSSHMRRPSTFDHQVLVFLESFSRIQRSGPYCLLRCRRSNERSEDLGGYFGW